MIVISVKKFTLNLTIKPAFKVYIHLFIMKLFLYLVNLRYPNGCTISYHNDELVKTSRIMIM